MKGFILLNLFLIYSRYCRTVHLGKSLKPKQFRPYNLTTHILISYEQELIKISRCNVKNLIQKSRFCDHISLEKPSQWQILINILQPVNLKKNRTNHF